MAMSTKWTSKGPAFSGPPLHYGCRLSETFLDSIVSQVISESVSGEPPSQTIFGKTRLRFLDVN